MELIINQHFEQQIFCPDCGKTKPRAKVYFRGDPRAAHDWECSCQREKNGLGYDWEIWAEKRDGTPLFLMRVTSSGIENKWIKNELHCPVCGRFIPIAIGRISEGTNEKCPNCKIIGFDYSKTPDGKFVVTASGIVSEIRNYAANHFHINIYPQTD